MIYLQELGVSVFILRRPQARLTENIAALVIDQCMGIDPQLNSSITDQSNCRSPSTARECDYLPLSSSVADRRHHLSVNR
ncbi:hypothetical protein CY34DRAFT_750331 [Suillus luteus UH-Slu-Lm8-n1]|uniref:Uncharacterized protein n=1 Tax=Suillus luteus UH-Slu-Lm8-n1 TaxID=930992 RepID=A0A0C9ZU16_9AGAM|nr:hypothetical protein CY34DRAFT_750331 [Suillus luteus UH-Slu-Lm8-n1]